VLRTFLFTVKKLLKTFETQIAIVTGHGMLIKIDWSITADGMIMLLHTAGDKWLADVG